MSSQFYCIELSFMHDFINQSKYSGCTLNVIAESDIGKYPDGQLLVSEEYARNNPVLLNKWKGLIVIS